MVTVTSAAAALYRKQAAARERLQLLAFMAPPWESPLLWLNSLYG
jgi:hypothetical protein